MAKLLTGVIYTSGLCRYLLFVVVSHVVFDLVIRASFIQYAVVLFLQ